jgi:hypothetical protein
MSTDFVPEGFTPPDGLIAEAFVLEPLGPEHNEADHAAWMSSIDHIHASPGFVDDFDDDPDPWPRPMTLEQNLSDLEQHAQDFGEADALPQPNLVATVGQPESRRQDALSGKLLEVLGRSLGEN